MNLKKTIRIVVCANLLPIFIFAILPALLISPEIEILQSFVDYINKD